MVIDIEHMKKSIDKETGSILFCKEDFTGIPDKVLNGQGFTIEIKNEEVVMIDIYYPNEVIGKMVEDFVKHELEV
jgi:hypothetical protein